MTPWIILLAIQFTLGVACGGVAMLLAIRWWLKKKNNEWTELDDAVLRMIKSPKRDP